MRYTHISWTKVEEGKRGNGHHAHLVWLSSFHYVIKDIAHPRKKNYEKEENKTEDYTLKNEKVVAMVMEISCAHV